MRFLRRFLAPVLLSSCLLVAVLYLFDIDRVASDIRGLDELAFGVLFLGQFITFGLLLVGYPAAYFLVRGDVAFRFSLPLLTVIGATGGAAINLILSLSLSGHALGNGRPDPTMILMGALAGLITGCIWAAFNADLFPRAPKGNDG